MNSAKHGDVKVYWKGNQLIVEPESIFNVEGLIGVVWTFRLIFSIISVEP
jgi:hypothetical protein